MSELTSEEYEALDAVLAVVRTAAISPLADFMDGHVEGFLAALAAVDPPLTVVRLAAERERDELRAALDQKIGAALIVAERRRQIEDEGYSSEHDAEHEPDEFAYAAVAYALPPTAYPSRVRYWPWESEAWKPKDRLRDLVRAGALIAAAIDAALRAEERE